jgi:hypothetical protein
VKVSRQMVYMVYHRGGAEHPQTLKSNFVVLAPTPRALAMANMPLPAVIDSGFRFSKVGSIFGRPSCLPALYGSSARLARAAPSGAPTVRLVAWTPCQRFA